MKKVCFLAYKMVVFSMPNRLFSSNQKSRVNIFNSTQSKFQVYRIITLQVTMLASLKNLISRKTRLKIQLSILAR